MDEATNPTTTDTLTNRILADCFARVSPRAIDRYTDSPRVRGIYAAVVAAFPDLALTPLWRVGDEHRVAIGGVIRATHLGTWRDVPATGRSIETMATVMLDLSDGGIVDIVSVSDSLTVAEQIGAVEPVGPKACVNLPAYGGAVRTQP